MKLRWTKWRVAYGPRANTMFAGLVTSPLDDRLAAPSKPVGVEFAP